MVWGFYYFISGIDISSTKIEKFYRMYNESTRGKEKILVSTHHWKKKIEINHLKKRKTVLDRISHTHFRMCEKCFV